MIETWKTKMKIENISQSEYLKQYSKDVLQTQTLSNKELIENLEPISKEYINIGKSKSELGFNMFTLVSDLYYRENFHSDLIKKFLDPNEEHNEGKKYLHSFINLLNKTNIVSKIAISDFQNSEVFREKKRIDILITDEVSKKAIIIENKINGAVDMNRQLPRYYNEIRSEYDVVAIVYLTLNREKRPDKSDWTAKERKKINSILAIIPAYEPLEKQVSLFDDWIISSINQSKDIENATILNHYGKLIKHLNTNTMDTVTLSKFYNSLKEGNNLETVISIRNMLNDLSEYLAIRVEDKYKSSCYPFEKISRYQKRDTVFEGCRINKYYIKIDVWCDENGYTIHFWDNQGKDIVKDFQEKIDLLQDFEPFGEGTSNIKKRYDAFSEEEIFDFLDKMLAILKNMKEN